MVSLTKRAKMQRLRDSIRKVTRLLTKSKLPVIMAGSNAMVEYGHDGKPKKVYLPALPDNASEELIDAIQGFVDHEVAHVLFSDFDCLIEGKRLGIPFLLNAVEDSFIERKIMDVYGGTKGNVAKMRDLFIDKFIEPHVKQARDAGVTDPKAWWALLGVCAIRAWAGHTEFVIYMDDKWDLLGEIPRLAKERKIPERLRAIKNTQESLKTAIRISHIVKDAEELPPEDEEEGEPDEEEDDTETDEDAEGDADEDSEGEDEAESDEESDDETDETESDEDADCEPEDGDSEGEEDGEGEGEGESDDDAESESDSGEDGDEGGDGEEDDGDGAHTSGTREEEDDEPEEEDSGKNTDSGEDDEEELPDPEEGEDEPAPGFKDEDMKGIEDFLEDVISEEAKQAQDASSYLPYTRDADRIEPLEDEAVEGRLVEEMEEEIKRNVAPVQRALANAFESRNKTFHLHGKRSGALSGPSLHRLVTNDERVYYQKHEAKTRDSAVQLVIDISGSMSGRKIRLAAQVGWALAEVLDRLKVKSEVICFTQYGLDWGPKAPKADGDPFAKFDDYKDREPSSNFSRFGPLYMPILKSWDEPHFTQMHKRHFTRMGNSDLPMLGNIDGESIEYAAMRLLAQREPGKVMIVLSDGQPAGDANYHKTSAHLKEVVRELPRKGINVVGIGIMDSSVSHYYPKHVVVNKVEDLAGTVMSKVRDALLQS